MEEKKERKRDEEKNKFKVCGKRGFKILTADISRWKIDEIGCTLEIPKAKVNNLIRRN